MPGVVCQWPPVDRLGRQQSTPQNKRCWWNVHRGRRWSIMSCSSCRCRSTELDYWGESNANAIKLDNNKLCTSFAQTFQIRAKSRGVLCNLSSAVVACRLVMGRRWCSRLEVIIIVSCIPLSWWIFVAWWSISQTRSKLQLSNKC